MRMDSPFDLLYTASRPPSLRRRCSVDLLHYLEAGPALTTSQDYNKDSMKKAPADHVTGSIHWHTLWLDLDYLLIHLARGSPLCCVIARPRGNKSSSSLPPYTSPSTPCPGFEKIILSE